MIVVWIFKGLVILLGVVTVGVLIACFYELVQEALETFHHKRRLSYHREQIEQATDPDYRAALKEVEQFLKETKS